MAKVKSSTEAMAAMQRALEKSDRDCTQASNNLTSKYRAIGNEWNDKKYHQLGEVINKVTQVLNANSAVLKEAANKVKELEKELEMYLNK